MIANTVRLVRLPYDLQPLVKFLVLKSMLKKFMNSLDLVLIATRVHTRLKATRIVDDYAIVRWMLQLLIYVMLSMFSITNMSLHKLNSIVTLNDSNGKRLPHDHVQQ